MKPSHRISRLLQSIVELCGLTPWLIGAVIVLFWFAAVAKAQEVPIELFQVTASVGGCAGTVVEPFQNAKGEWKWVVITAAHCVGEGETRNVKLLYPPSQKKEFSSKCIYRDRANDVAVLSFNPIAPVPFAKIGEPPPEGAEVFTVGYPSGELKGKPSTVTGNNLTGKHLTIRDDIWYGNSGGGLLHNGNLVGVASSRTGSSGPSIFARTESVKLAYHVASVQLGFQ